MGRAICFVIHSLCDPTGGPTQHQQQHSRHVGVSLRFLLLSVSGGGLAAHKMKETRFDKSRSGSSNLLCDLTGVPTQHQEQHSKHVGFSSCFLLLSASGGGLAAHKTKENSFKNPEVG